MSTLTTFSRRSFLVMPLAFAACKPSSQVMKILGFTMGTAYNVVAIDHGNRLNKADVQAAIDTALTDVNRSMSNWDESSEISRFNAGRHLAAVQMSSDLNHVMGAAAEVNHASAGRFDTTVGPLIEAWGFGAPGGLSMPSEARLTAARAGSGHANTLEVGTGAMRKIQPDAQVYLSAIGKGYGADHVGRALESLGIKDYMVEIGGDLYAAGKNPDGLPWQIGIESPNTADRSLMGVVGLSGLGLASSGDYRNYYEVDGTRYSHLIDPATGRPVTHKTASATVLADNAMLADAWSTAMLILGREQGLEIAESLDIAVHFAERAPSGAGFAVHTSSAFNALTA